MPWGHWKWGVAAQMWHSVNRRIWIIISGVLLYVINIAHVTLRLANAATNLKPPVNYGGLA